MHTCGPRDLHRKWSENCSNVNITIFESEVEVPLNCTSLTCRNIWICGHQVTVYIHKLEFLNGK